MDLSDVRRTIKNRDGNTGGQSRKISDAYYTEYVNSNVKCAKIIDIIFDLINELMDKDRNISGFQKAIVKTTARNFKNPVKEYVLNMKKEDADKVIKNVSNVIIEE